MAVSDPLDYRDSEVVFGIVAPVGVDLRQCSAVLRDHLEKFQYAVDEVRLSGFLRQPHIRSKHRVRIGRKGEHHRITSLMTAGNRVRDISGREDILALYAASDITQRRAPGAFTPTAHVLLSLKRPEEVATLRHIYGPGFFLIGVYGTEAGRLKYLTEDRGVPHDAARRLLTRDQDEMDPHGQRTSRTFQLADVFVHLDEHQLGAFKKSVQRFIDLAFGAPFETPTREEHAMFLAFAASLRSADLSRQVGAVVVSSAGDIIATGANDVPAFGGGLYWPGQGDQRDFILGRDSNKEEIERIAGDIANELFPGADGITRDKVLQSLRKTRLHDLTEFGRPVHAEMEALLECARSGVSPAGGTLFTTTFPCHNCAKHIVDAGIQRVLFVEPYPKSKASQLHADAVSLEVEDPTKVSFMPFVGVAARRYFDVFSTRISSGWPLERKRGVRAVEFRRSEARPRVPMAPTSFVERERIATQIIRDTMQ